MRSLRSKFNFIDRGKGRAMVLLPGWATDHRIFSTLDLGYDYIVPLEYSPFHFEDELSSFLDGRGLRKVSLFGWSMGGFLAADFAARYPEKVDTLLLAGMRRRYEEAGLVKIREYLRKNAKAFLYSFYSDCFSAGETHARTWFRKHLLKEYCTLFGAESLLNGIDYLSAACLNSAVPESVTVRGIHGTLDRIAPPEGAAEIQKALPHIRYTMIDGAGHMPFLRDDIQGYVT
jgi:pimeloyl-ACP methyl ester carboxylesterase